MIIAKVHKTQDGRKVIALCDKELIGKIFEEGNLQLDLTSDFYNGEEMDENRIKEEIKDSHVVNVVGEESIKLATKLGIVNEDNVIKIKGIPHVQVVLD